MAGPDLAIFLILDDPIEIVQASLTGSILGNLSLVLGPSFLLAGLRHEQQHRRGRDGGPSACS